jgi:hypothetical protein
MDRDVVAAMNLSIKGASVFMRSKGDAGEAMVVFPLVHSVDASKLTFHQRKGETGYVPSS